MIALVLFALFFILLFLSVSVAIALGLSTFITAYIFEGYDSLVDLASNLFSQLDKYPLVAIPMFILAGNLLSKGRSAKKLLSLQKHL